MTAPISAQVMRTLADLLNTVLNDPGSKANGFCLLVFKTGQPGIANYISNCERADMILALHETVARLEGKQDFPTPETHNA